MDLQLRNKVALVTGGSRGIGAATAKLLAEEGVDMGRQSATALPADYAKTKLLTHRYAEPEEIARVIVFVASPVAGFMTGATIDINGGRVLR